MAAILANLGDFMTEQLGYQALGQWHKVTLLPLNATDTSRAPRAMRGMKAVTAGRASGAGQSDDVAAITRVVNESPVLQSRVSDPSRLVVVQGKMPVRRAAASMRRAAPTPISTYGAMTLATETVIAEGLRQADLTAAKNFGAKVIDEGLDGKVLLRVESVDQAFALVDLLLKREVGSATPNFLRRVARTKNSAPQSAWALKKTRVPTAWNITKGHKDIKVAVLDEGVDTSHPALRSAVVAERDFIGGNDDSAMPSGNDAHGTACAGVVLSRDDTYSGIAPGCSLIAARIAMDDGTGNWVIEDFSTADAIDWSWRQGAAVLSNSWGGGAPSDAISRAFARARTQGRGGLGSLVVIAAGNDQQPIDFPGDLPGYVTVGASNPADERKTKTSSDGEFWWGSNFGATMTLLAPGVFIWTTDISGAAGYKPDNFTKEFNGTSSATPAVAGAAALMMSANQELSASAVRTILGNTAQSLTGQSTWTPENGWGRLDVGAAVAAARDAGVVPPAKKAAKKAGAKKAAVKKAGVKKAAAESRRKGRRQKGRRQKGRAEKGSPEEVTAPQPGIPAPDAAFSSALYSDIWASRTTRAAAKSNSTGPKTMWLSIRRQPRRPGSRSRSPRPAGMLRAKAGASSWCSVPHFPRRHSPVCATPAPFSRCIVATPQSWWRCRRCASNSIHQSSAAQSQPTLLTITSSPRASRKAPISA